MDSPGSTLPVPGANADMDRVAKLIERVGPKLDGINVTADSHHVIDISHPGFYLDANKKNPPPFTIIPSSDLESGVWTVRNAYSKPPVLGGLSLGEYTLKYAKALEKAGIYQIMVWPEHCLIGSHGHSFQANLQAALNNWERKEFATVDVWTKGSCTFTEHYGAVMAEVPLPNDPSTGLNTAFLNLLAGSDIVAVAGEASSHCVLRTLQQIVDHIGEEHLKKFHLLTDCMSPVIHPVIDFPSIADAFLKSLEQKGMTLTTSTKFLK